MSQLPPSSNSTPDTQHNNPSASERSASTLLDGETCQDGLMACPVCGHEMPDLKGGKATICPACGFKDSCCY